jgi:hypothetical protein
MSCTKLVDGDEIGNRVVIGNDTKRVGNKSYRRVRCKSCNKEQWVEPYRLKNGSSNRCRLCPTHSGIQSPHWKGFGELGNHYLSKVKSNADKRNLEFTITPEIAYNKFQTQDERCFYSGVKLKLFRCKHNIPFNELASIDRRDNTKGYTAENIQWVSATVNLMKSDMTEDEFLGLVASINEYRNL